MHNDIGNRSIAVNQRWDHDDSGHAGEQPSSKDHKTLKCKCNVFLLPNLKEQQKLGRSPFTVS